MASRPKALAGSEFRTLFEVGTVAGRNDGELLDRFLRARGPDAELAFAALMERHGPMIWRVCRDVLRESGEADDAFQATFLVLARHAATIRNRSSLGAWLHGVALRVSRAAQSRSHRRRNHDRSVARPLRHETPADLERLDGFAILHEEVGRLPEKYRAPVVLCYFEGLTHDQAASQLGWPVGTVRSRLAKARDRLRPHLQRRGVAPSLAMPLVHGLTRAVPASLVSATMGMAVGAGAAGTVPAAVSVLVEALIRETTLMKISMIATGLVATALVSTAGVRYVAVASQAPDVVEKAASPKAVEKAASPRPIGPPPQTDTEERATTLSVREPTNPLGPGLRTTRNSSRVLWTRWNAAWENLRVLEAQHQNAQVDSSRVTTARGEVRSLAAELKSHAEDLADEVDLLQAQIAIKQAEIQAAEAQLGKASEIHANTEKLIKNRVVSSMEARQSQLEVDFRTAELARKRAERSEVELRIKQTIRRRDEASELSTKTKEILPER